MNPIKNMWMEVNKTMQDIWPILPVTNSDALWTLVSDARYEVATSHCYVSSVFELSVFSNIQR